MEKITIESVFGIGDTIKWKNKSGIIQSGEIKAINFEGCRYPDDYNFNFLENEVSFTYMVLKDNQITEVKQNQIIINI